MFFGTHSGGSIIENHMFIFFNYILQGVSKVLELLFFGGGVMGQSERFIVKHNSKLGRHPKLLEFF